MLILFPQTYNLIIRKLCCMCFEDNETVIKMIIKGRRPTIRHVSRTHRVSLDKLFDRINMDPKMQIKYVDTKNQLADMLTKGNLTRDEWNHLFRLFNIRKGHRKERERNELWQSQDRRWKFECVELPGDAQSIQSKLESCSTVRGNLQLKMQIKMTQHRVLK